MGYGPIKASARTDDCPFKEQDMAQNVLVTVVTSDSSNSVCMHVRLGVYVGWC